MTRRRPLVLLPPSKGKAAGGAAPTFGAHLAGSDHPLAGVRREVLAAVTAAAPSLADDEVVRLAGVRHADVPATRRELADLAEAPTLPAHRRYTGVVHGNAGLAHVRPRRAGVDVRIVSALLGIVALHEPVPSYRLEVAGRLAGPGGLARFWRSALTDHLEALGRGRLVWDLLPAEHRRVWDPELRRRQRVATVTFVRPDGRAANAARAKVAKGRFVAALLARPELTPGDVAGGVDLGEGWSADSDGVDVTVVSHHGS